MRRGLAVVGALALVAIALVVRSALDDDDSNGDGPVVIACIPELIDVCAEADGVRIVPIGDADATATVTLEPMPQVEALGGAPEALAIVGLASTELVLVARAGATDCVDWACAAGQLSRRAVLPAPTSAAGLLVLAEAATDFFGGPYAANDFSIDFDAFLTGLPAQDDPVADMSAAFGQAGPIVSGGLGADLTRRVAQPAFAGLELHATGARARAVVAGDDVPQGAYDRLYDAFLDAGWDPPGAEPTGLPDAGVLFALRERYETLSP